MNWWVILAMLGQILAAFEAIKASIDAGQPASTPPFNTYIDGKHGSVTISWTPLP